MDLKKFSPRNRKLIKKYGIKVNIPGFKAKAKPFQATGILFGVDCMEKYHQFLLADQQGLGKTIEALGISMAMRKKIGRCLIVCPPPALEEWSSMIRKFTTASFTCIHDRYGFDGRAFYTVVNHAFLPRVYKRFLGDTKFGMVIVDEGHNFKNKDAKRTIALKALGADFRMDMTGTPLLNNTGELWTQLDFLNPGGWGDYYEFTNRYCMFKKVKIVYRKFGRVHTNFIDKFRGPKNIKELRKKIKPFFIRRLKSEIAGMLPKQRQVRLVNLTGEQKKLYNKVEKEIKIEIRDAKKHGINKKRAIVVTNKFQRLRQICQTTHTIQDSDSSSKFDWLIEHLLAVITSPTKILIGTPFKRSAVAIYERIRKLKGAKYNPVLVTGDVPQDKCDQRKKKFQTDKRCRAYVGTIAKNREALNLPMADYVYMIGKDLVAKYNEQFEDRADRIEGRAEGVPVTVVEILVRNSIETRIEEEILRPKIELFDITIDAIGRKKNMKDPENIINVISRLIERD